MTDLITAIISNSVVLGAIGFLTKSVINRQLDRDTAKFTAELQTRTSTEIEKFRSSLETERLRLQISYGGIFEKQAEAILDLYRQAADFQRSANWALDVAEDDKDFFQEFIASWHKLNDTFRRNRVLLPEELDRKLKVFVDDFYSKVFQHQRRDAQYKTAKTPEQIQALHEQQEKLRTAVAEEMPALLEQIVSSMRDLLGTKSQVEGSGGI
jgi:DNA primase large subunit